MKRKRNCKKIDITLLYNVYGELIVYERYIKDIENNTTKYKALNKFQVLLLKLFFNE